MEINITPFEKAISALQRGILRSKAAPGDEEFQDAVILRFKYTIDLVWKLLQRYIKNAGIQDQEIRTKRDLFREGARIGLIENPEKWFVYYEARNATSHTYNQEIAGEVYRAALQFFDDAVLLLRELQKEAGHA